MRVKRFFVSPDLRARHHLRLLPPTAEVRHGGMNLAHNRLQLRDSLAIGKANERVERQKDLTEPVFVAPGIDFIVTGSTLHPHAVLISVARSRRDSTSVNSRQSFSGGIMVPV